MSNGVNRVILVGHLGADPELRTTQSGRQVAEFSLATTRRWSDAEGGLKEETEWHRVKVWGRMAAVCQQYLSKGRQVYVEGRVQSRKYVDREGIERKVWDVVAQQVIFLGGPRQAMGLASRDAPEEPMAASDGLPF